MRPETAPEASRRPAMTPTEKDMPGFMRSTIASRGTRTAGGRRVADLLDGMSTSIRHLSPTYATPLAPSEEAEAAAAAAWLSLPVPPSIPEATLAPNNPAEQFEDFHFPAHEQSIWGRAASPPEDAPPMEWGRLEGVLYDAKRQEHPLLRGNGFATGAQPVSAGRGFHGALATVATREDLILDLIVSDDFAGQGLYTFALYKHGKWHEVSVDGDVPIDPSTGEPGFLHGAPGELWPALLEKAYAKLHGSYHALENVDARCALVDLTGGTLMNVNLSDVQPGFEGVAVWPLLRKQWAQGSLLCVSCDAASPRAEALEAVGLDAGCVYPVLELRETGASDFLVRLANPYSPSVWSGEDWIQSEAGAAALNELDIEFALGDGTWWMPLSALCARFDLITCCCLLPAHHHHIGLAAAWLGDCTGGPPAGATFCTNPQFNVSVRKGGTITVAISARDTCVEFPASASREGPPANLITPLSFGCVVVQHHRRKADRVWRVAAADIVAECTPDTFREVACTFEAEPGVCYVVVPYCTERGREGAFALRLVSANPIELTRQLPPSGLRASCEWNVTNVGGPPGGSRFASNPQWLLRIPRKTRIALLVEARDEVGQSWEGATGVLIATAERSADGPGRANYLLTSANEGDGSIVVAGPAEGVPNGSDGGTHHASLVTTLPAGEYAVVAFQHEPVPSGTVLLSLISDPATDMASSVGMASFPATCSYILNGRWVDGRCGGSRQYPSWLQNPSFRLETDAPQRIRITVHRRRPPTKPSAPAAMKQSMPSTAGSAAGGEEDAPTAGDGASATAAAAASGGLAASPTKAVSKRRPGKPRKVPFVVENLVGFYVLHCEPPSPKDNVATARQAVLFESAFLPRGCTLVHEVNVPAGVCTIILTRFAPAEASGEGPDDLFAIEVGSNSNFHLEPAVTG